jgi:glycosyltransferase involved in cell wall biosynthesis
VTSAASALAVAYAAFASILAVNAWYLRRSRRLGPALPDTPPLVSVLIPARNEEDNLARLLPTILQQDYPSFEVIVYDDASDDRTGDVLRAFADPRLVRLRGTGPPAGWLGKVHALHQASRRARGEVLLFLDADVLFADTGALTRLVRRFLGLASPAVLTGIPRLEGGGRLVVSLIPFVVFTYLPLPLSVRSRIPHLSGMNGQCWMIARREYERLQPHVAHRADVLEDIRIGRYLKAHGVVPHYLDLQNEVRVRMYGSLPDAWRGLRKNTYPFMGETVWSFGLILASYVALFVLAPLAAPWSILAWYGLKAGSDRLVRMPLWVSALAPLSLALGAALQLDSAIAHWTGRAEWKGRTVVRRRVDAAGGTASP